jgi:hypothetical protein
MKAQTFLATPFDQLTDDGQELMVAVLDHRAVVSDDDGPFVRAFWYAPANSLAPGGPAHSVRAVNDE